MAALINSSVASVLQGSFVWVSISQITWINGPPIHPSKQIAFYKSQAHRIKDFISYIRFFLSLTLLYNIKFSRF